MRIYDPDAVTTSTSKPYMINIVCPSCRREWYYQPAGWGFNDVILCPSCSKRIGVQDGH